MEIVLVSFSLQGLSEQEYAAMCEQLAPAFAAVPGLVSKVWLADTSEGVYGGVYTFESAGAVDEFLTSELFAGVGRTPELVNVSVRRFGVLQEPTAVTRGWATVAA